MASRANRVAFVPTELPPACYCLANTSIKVGHYSEATRTIEKLIQYRKANMAFEKPELVERFVARMGNFRKAVITARSIWGYDSPATADTTSFPSTVVIVGGELVGPWPDGGAPSGDDHSQTVRTLAGTDCRPVAGPLPNRSRRAKMVGGLAAGPIRIATTRPGGVMPLTH